MRKTVLAYIATAILLCACVKQHKAEETVKAFLDANLKSQSYNVSFTKIDSTKLVSDSTVNVMRAFAAKNTAFKPNIQYGAEPPQPSYIFTKTRIVVGNDTLTHTFYLTPELSDVVAFKDN